jgi:hypothetical protein
MNGAPSETIERAAADAYATTANHRCNWATPMPAREGCPDRGHAAPGR